MLDPEGRVAHVWKISQKEVHWPHQEDENIFPHGFEIAPDGSILVAYDGGSTLTRYDYCSRIIWCIEGEFHHSIAFEDDRYFRIWERVGTEKLYGEYLVKIDYATGDILKKIPLQKVMDANPDIDIFGVKQKDSADGSQWISDYWHANDIDPLPKKFEHLYPVLYSR